MKCRFIGSRAILSGPAGGVVGVARTAFDGTPVIGFDMGGTSTDVSVIIAVRQRSPRLIIPNVIRARAGDRCPDETSNTSQVCRFAGELEHVMQSTTAGVTIQIPQVGKATATEERSLRAKLTRAPLVTEPSKRSLAPKYPSPPVSVTAQQELDVPFDCR